MYPTATPTTLSTIQQRHQQPYLPVTSSTLRQQQRHQLNEISYVDTAEENDIHDHEDDNATFATPRLYRDTTRLGIHTHHSNAVLPPTLMSNKFTTTVWISPVEGRVTGQRGPLPDPNSAKTRYLLSKQANILHISQQ